MSILDFINPPEDLPREEQLLAIEKSAKELLAFLRERHLTDQVQIWAKDDGSGEGLSEKLNALEAALRGKTRI